MCGGGIAGRPNYKIYKIYKKGQNLKFAIAHLLRGYALLFLEIAERICPDDDDFIELAVPDQRTGAVLAWRDVPI